MVDVTALGKIEFYHLYKSLSNLIKYPMDNTVCRTASIIARSVNKNTAYGRPLNLLRLANNSTNTKKK